MIPRVSVSRLSWQNVAREGDGPGGYDVKFWDASAIVPLLINQPATERVSQLLEDDPEIVIWWATPIECISAVARLRREGAFDRNQEESVVVGLGVLGSSWYEVQPGESVRRQAMRLLRIHALRAPDGLQLAAALEWAGSPPGASDSLVTLDRRLAEVADLEGFKVLP